MTTTKHTVLHLIDSLGTGGAETLVVNTIKDLPEFNHVVVILNSPEDLKQELPAAISYYKLQFDVKRNFFGTLLQLKKIIAKENPGIVHAHLFWSIILGRLAKTRRAAFIFTLHGMMSDRLFSKKWHHRWLERITISKAQQLIAVSQAVMNDYLRCIPFKGQQKVVYNYVPDIFFNSRKPDYSQKKDQFQIASTGSLRKIKNFDVQVKALGLLGNQYRLDIYGYGGEEAHLLKLMQEFNISNVRLMGNTQDMYNILPDYDLYLMSSFSEGNSIALSEAMACGLPALLSDIPSFKESTNNQALYFDVNDPSGLAENVKQFGENEVLRKQVGETNFQLAYANVRKSVFLEKMREQYCTSLRKNFN